MTRDNQTDYITATELAESGWTPQDVRRFCPWAVEYTALDGSPCWPLKDLRPLFEGKPQEDEP